MSPTASASANRNDSTSGLCVSTFSISTNSTSSTVIRMIIRPKRRAPTSKAVGGGAAARPCEIAPSAVARPVVQTSIVPVPLSTDVPMNTACGAPSRAPVHASSPTAAFSTGNDSPVSSDWSTNRCFASTRTPSVGTSEPLARLTTSPGTRCVTATGRTAPSRRACACSATEFRSLSAACPARYSCTKSSTTLTSTSATITAAPVISPVSAESTLATSRIRISGFANRRANWSQAGTSASERNSLRP